jgi:hypothetical protein
LRLIDRPAVLKSGWSIGAIIIATAVSFASILLAGCGPSSEQRAEIAEQQAALAQQSAARATAQADAAMAAAQKATEAANQAEAAVRAATAELNDASDKLEKMNQRNHDNGDSDTGSDPPPPASR